MIRVSWTPLDVTALLDLIVNGCQGALTTTHAMSSHGLPVLVRDDGVALGSAEVGELTVDNYPSLGHAPLTEDEMTTINAARSAGYVVRVPEQDLRS